MSTIQSLADWPSGVVLPLGPHLQESVSAIRALADADGYDLRQPAVTILHPPLVKLIDYAGGLTGKYGGQIQSGLVGENVTAGLQLPEGLSPGENVLVINIEEDTSLGYAEGIHTLQLNSYVVPFAWGRTNEDPPRPIVWVRGGVGETASPLALTAGGTTPDTNDWNGGLDGSPVDITVCTAPVWDGASDTWKYNTRVLSFDARGLLYNVTAESQATITATTACP